MDMNKLKESIREALDKDPEVLAVYLFGSMSNNLNSNKSDLDIGVVFENPQIILEKPQKSLQKYEELYDLFIPLVKNLPKKINKLDLIFIQNASLPLQKDVVLNGKLLYVKDIQKLLQYKEKTLLKYADFKPFLKNYYQTVYNTRL